MNGPYGLFPLTDIGSDSDSDPLIEMHVIGMEIGPWDGDPQNGYSNHLGKGSKSESESKSVQWKHILHRVWNPSPILNPSPAVERSH